MNRKKRWIQAAVCLLLTAGLFAGSLTTDKGQGKPIDDAYRCWYEIFPGSFYDGNGDGKGDLEGIRQKLDYVEELGFNGIWLTPVMASGSYHRYDVTDYEQIDAELGTMADFEKLVKECHERGIRLILDLPFNHTSSEHPWFKESCAYLESLQPGEAPDASVCPYVEYYHFERDREGIASWYPVGDSGWYYEGVFWSGMPDLALETEAVLKEVEAVFDFWLEKGVDGFRLDAAKEYFTGEAQKNIELLGRFTEHVKKAAPDGYLVAEVWEGQSVLQEYYKSGIDSLFHFPAAQQDGAIVKTAKGMVEPGEFFSWIQRHQEQDHISNPDYIDAPFISNHDTTRVSAQCVNDERTMKLAAGLLMMMPGSPFVYYGEELGMKSMGTKDENKRLPMYWTDSDGKGVTVAPEGADEVGHIFPPADVQEKDENSIYHYYKEAIAVRNRHPEIARGTAEPLGQDFPEHTGAMKMTWEDRSYIIVCNNGKNAAHIDLRKCLGEGEYRMTDMLMTGEQKAGLTDGILALPEAGIAVLEKG